MKKLFTCMLGICCFICMAVAQTETPQFKIIGENILPGGISSDGKYIAGENLLNGNLFLWTQEEGFSLFRSEIPFIVKAVSGNGVIMGSILDPELTYKDWEGNDMPLWSGGYFKDGKWNSLGTYPGLEVLTEESGSLAEAISADGNIIAGSVPVTSSYPVKFAPVLWKDGVPEYLKYEAEAIGASVQSLSADGRVAAGYESMYGIDSYPVVWVNGEKRKVLHHGIYPFSELIVVSPSGKYMVFNINRNYLGIYNIEDDKLDIMKKNADAGTVIPVGISDNGIVVGSYFNNDFSGRYIFIGSPQTGMWNLSEYMESIGVEIGEDCMLDMVTGISADGKLLAGSAFKGDIRIGWMLDFSGHFPGYNPPRYFEAEQTAYGDFSLSWEAPLPDAVNTFTGYNIYRNGDKINTSPVSSTTFEDKALPNGNYTYMVTAVWNADKESAGCEPVKLNNGKLSLPFIESFDSRNLDTHFWNTEYFEMDNWQVNNYSDFTPPILDIFCPSVGEYSLSLYTPYLDAGNSKEVSLSFNYSSPFYMHDLITDTLKVEINNGTGWNTLATYPALKESFGFFYEKVNISEWMTGNDIQVRFTIYGESTGNGSVWGIDNVRIYDAKDEVTAEAPANLHAARNKDGSVSLAWSDSHETAQLSYLASDNIATGLGNEATPFIMANKFTSESLGAYKGYKLLSVSAYIMGKDDGKRVFKLAAFKGKERILEQPVSSYTPDSWNEFVLDTPLIIEDAEDLYYGIEVVSHSSTDLPVGSASTMSIDGLSNLLSEDGGNTWQTLLNNDSGTSFWTAWALTAYVVKNENSTPKNGIMGYKVYRDGISLFPEDEIRLIQSYTDEEAPKEACCYTVKAYYITQELSEESGKACVGDYTGIENKDVLDTVNVYPNPVRDYIYINGNYTDAVLMNMDGRSLLSTTENRMDVTMVPAGMYILKIDTGNGTLTKKVMKE